MKKTAFLCLALIAAVACSQGVKNTTSPLYLDLDADIESRIDDALARMTLEEKVAVIHAQSKFSSAGVPRLGIPELWCTDGPHGVRSEVLWDEWNQAGWTNDSIVAFPALTCLAATWNKDMAALYGRSVGEEARFREKDVLLGPGVNIYRTPLGGRNFEYMGEDPYLASRMVVPYVQEVQKNGVATCVKHFCLNNEETWRHETDVDVSDRALYEIYLPAFKAATLEGGSWSIMSSYNSYRGQHVSHNHRLLMEILKGEWGYDGAVISDWGGVHDTDEAIANGMDIEFGTWTDGLRMGQTNAYDAYFLADAYLERLRDGRADIATLDEKCRRVLRLIFRTAMNPDKPFGNICSEEHYAAARRIIGEGIVLLKNDGDVLPVAGVKKLAVIGENAVKMMTVGGGSSSLKAQHEVLPLDGIRARAEKDGIEVTFARGYVGSVDSDQDGISNGQDLTDTRSAVEILAEAVEVAAEADMVIFIGGLNKSANQDCEGADRTSLELPYGQGGVIEALSKANPRLAVLLVSGNAVSMPWIDSAPAIAQVWYGGSEAGNGIADVVFGDVCPSGKLPFTFPKQLSDSPAHLEGKTFPVNGKNVYEEGIYVGYRWFENKDIEPLFAFGHGLSYTSFEYGEARLDKDVMKADGTLKLNVDVTNTGTRDGAEVVQLYISDTESTLDRPLKELKGFEKVYLKAGETGRVSFTIDSSMLQYFDDTAHEWVTEPGEFTALVGSASDDIRTSCSFVLK